MRHPPPTAAACVETAQKSQSDVLYTRVLKALRQGGASESGVRIVGSHPGKFHFTQVCSYKEKRHRTPPMSPSEFCMSSPSIPQRASKQRVGRSGAPVAANGAQRQVRIPRQIRAILQAFEFESKPQNEVIHSENSPPMAPGGRRAIVRFRSVRFRMQASITECSAPPTQRNIAGTPPEHLEYAP